jgi:hypothetical protein
MRGKLDGFNGQQVLRLAQDDKLRVEKLILKDPEDEASQLNRLGETGLAPSLQDVFVGASRQYCVVSCVQFLTLLRRPSAFEQFRTES